MTVEEVDITEIRGKHRQVKLEQVYAMDNLLLADKRARKGKAWKYGVRKFDRDREQNLLNIQEMLRDRTYRTSAVKQVEQWCPCGKNRVITKLPYYPDHIIHHALMNVIGPAMKQSYYFDSYASIQGRGTSFARRRVRRFIDLHKDRDIVYAKMDFTKFYQNISQGIVYEELCRMYHDDGIRWLLKEVVTAIDEGLGIGLFPIQPIANFHLNGLDRMICQEFGGQVHLFRYCDDMLLVGFDTKEVWRAVEAVRRYARERLRQPLHGNVSVEHVTNATGIDFVGYVFYKDYTLLRKKIKVRFRRKYNKLRKQDKLDTEKARSVLASYKGWLMQCNGINLWRTITAMRKFSDLNIKSETVRDGKVYYEVPLVQCGFLVERKIVVKDFQTGVKTKNGNDRYVVLIEEGGRECKFLTNNPRMKNVLDQCREQNVFPFEATLKCEKLRGSINSYYFE